MAAKKKTRKQSKKATAGKVKLTRKPAQKRKALKKSAKRKTAPPNAVAKKKNLKKAAPTAGKKNRKKSRGPAEVTFSDKMTDLRTGILSGDMQGLSNRESADSESVDELIEEGNAFEAGIVSGVQDAEARSEREVHTREVSEDDVPEEYLDQD